MFENARWLYSVGSSHKTSSQCCLLLKSRPTSQICASAYILGEKKNIDIHALWNVFTMVHVTAGCSHDISINWQRGRWAPAQTDVAGVLWLRMVIQVHEDIRKCRCPMSASTPSIKENIWNKSRVPTNLESQGIWVVRESQGKVREFWMESGIKKKTREINKRTRNKKEREIRYII